MERERVEVHCIKRRGERSGDGRKRGEWGSQGGHGVNAEGKGYNRAACLYTTCSEQREEGDVWDIEWWHLLGSGGGTREIQRMDLLGMKRSLSLQTQGTRRRREGRKKILSGVRKELEGCFILET